MVNPRWESLLKFYLTSAVQSFQGCESRSLSFFQKLRAKLLKCRNFSTSDKKWQPNVHLSSISFFVCDKRQVWPKSEISPHHLLFFPIKSFSPFHGHFNFCAFHVSHWNENNLLSKQKVFPPQPQGRRETKDVQRTMGKFFTRGEIEISAFHQKHPSDFSGSDAMPRLQAWLSRSSFVIPLCCLK